MKLYTEEQIEKLITYLQNDYLDFSLDNLDFNVIEKDGFIQFKPYQKNQKEELILMPIKLPTDDEIERAASAYSAVNSINKIELKEKYNDFIYACKWYREQLKQRQ